EERRLPRLDAVARRLLAHAHVDLGAGVLADLPREHALGVGDAELLAIDDDFRLRRRLAVDARPDLDVDALAARAENDSGAEDSKKTQAGFGHGVPPCSDFRYRVPAPGRAPALTSQEPGCSLRRD